MLVDVGPAGLVGRFGVFQEITVGVVAPAYVDVPLSVAQERGSRPAPAPRHEGVLAPTERVTARYGRGEVHIALTAPEGGVAHHRQGGSLRRSGSSSTAPRCR